MSLELAFPVGDNTCTSASQPGIWSGVSRQVCTWKCFAAQSLESKINNLALCINLCCVKPWWIFSVELYNLYLLWLYSYRINLCSIVSPKWMWWRSQLSETPQPERQMRKMHVLFDKGEFWKERLEISVLKCRKWKPVAKRLFLICYSEPNLVSLPLVSVP